MKTITYFVNAFCSNRFLGNPAAVCPLESWPSDQVLQKIATENNLSETAFFVVKGDHYDLRWFTPTIEVDLCGHATLAAAYVLFNELGNDSLEITFLTRSGEIRVRRNQQFYSLNLPTFINHRIDGNELKGVLSNTGEFIFESNEDTLMAILQNEKAVIDASPNLEALKKLNKSLIISAKGDSPQVDYVYRFFAPHEGIDEDPVTGSANCYLAPYWQERLSKDEFIAWQLSNNGGEIQVSMLRAQRVEVAGQANLYNKEILEIG